MDRAAAAAAIEAFLRALGRDPATEPDLVGTGARVTAAFADELCSGYDVDVAALLASNTLPVSEGNAGDVVVLRDVAVATTCPHHLMTALGTATVAFSPATKIVGLGALAAVVDAFARRLTLQEAIGVGVVDALDAHLSPRWAACRLVLRHGCLEARGERQHGARVETVALSPRIRDDGTRALIHGLLGVGREDGDPKVAP